MSDTLGICGGIYRYHDIILYCFTELRPQNVLVKLNVDLTHFWEGS